MILGEQNSLESSLAGLHEAVAELTPAGQFVVNLIVVNSHAHKHE